MRRSAGLPQGGTWRTYKYLLICSFFTEQPKARMSWASRVRAYCAGGNAGRQGKIGKYITICLLTSLLFLAHVETTAMNRMMGADKSKEARRSILELEPFWGRGGWGRGISPRSKRNRKSRTARKNRNYKTLGTEIIWGGPPPLHTSLHAMLCMCVYRWIRIG